jgi:hypothetical protein
MALQHGLGVFESVKIEAPCGEEHNGVAAVGGSFGWLVTILWLVKIIFYTNGDARCELSTRSRRSGWVSVNRGW